MPHIVLMAKAPQPGQVKTRLVPPLTTTEAAACYAAMLRDMVARLRHAASWKIHLAITPPRALLPRVPSTWQVFGQRGADLGDRLTHAFARVFARGAQRVMALGVDSPTVPWRYIQQAMTALHRTDVVVGPTDDGGCYCIGLRAPQPRLLAQIAWSTSRVEQQLRARARQHGLRLRRAPGWYDIDTMQDLRRYRGQVLRARCAPHFRVWLRQYVDRLSNNRTGSVFLKK